MSGRSVLTETSHRSSAYSANTRADPYAGLVPPAGSRSQEGEPFIHPLELGSHLLFLAVVLLPIAIVGGIVVGYLAFVA